MGIARNLARVIADNSGAIAAGNLGNAIPADESITTAKLANDAITTAKLVNDAITTAKLVNNAITKAKIGFAGAVLQAGNVVDPIAQNTTIDSATMTTLYTLSITPSKTNTRILFYTNWMIYINTSGNFACDHRILANGSTVLNGAQDSHNPYFTGASGFALMHRGAGMRSHDPGTTSTQSYAFQFCKSDPTRAAMNFNHNSQYNSCISWMEVQI